MAIYVFRGAKSDEDVRRQQSKDEVSPQKVPILLASQDILGQKVFDIAS
jgi:hypothetical protein